MRKRLQLLLLTMLIVHVHLCSQSLTIDETITYINKLSKENPTIWHDPNKDIQSVAWECETEKWYYTLTINKEGLLSVYTTWSTYNCKDQKFKYENKQGLSEKFFIEDIDLNKIQMLDDGFQLSTINNYKEITESYVDSNNRVIEFKNSSSGQFHASDHYNGVRFYNAIKYLISSALEQGYTRNDKNDPFTENSNKVQPTTNNSQKLEYKVKLREKNGVFNLDVNVGGLISNFILDSGSGESNISSDIENKLVTKGVIKQNDYLSNGLYMLADGTVIESKRVKISKIIVGGKIIYNVIASVGPIGSPNLLGQSFLNKTNSWTIDNSKKCLIIR